MTTRFTIGYDGATIILFIDTFVAAGAEALCAEHRFVPIEGEA